MASSMIMGAAYITLSATTASAAAATTDTTAAPANEVQEVVITGSHIRGNVQSPSPIAVSTAAQIATLKAVNVEQALEHMTGPDFTGGLSSASNNGGIGLSEIGLRNLGPSRTLILIDGQRLIPIFSGAASVPDLNSVPLGMVDRIEVLKDGASSIYGADALGGVINIITKKNANGLTFDSSIGGSQHGGGTTYTLGTTLAVNSDRGNVLIGLNWDHTDAIGQSQRGWAIDPHLNDPNFEGGSAYRGQLDLLQDENSDSIWAGGVKYSQTDPALATKAPNLVYLPGQGLVKMNAGGPNWNDLAGSLDRKQISFSGHYNLTDNIRVIGEGFYTDRNSVQHLRPEPILGDTIATIVNGQQVFAGFVVPNYAPGNTTGQDITAFLTPVQFGPRTYLQNSETYRIRVGLEGTIANKWDWEVGYVDQENHTREDIGNSGNWNHLAQITGQIQCIDVPGGCSPNTLPVGNIHSVANGGPSMLPTVMPNFFNGPNMFTAQQLAYLEFTSHDNNRSYERYAYANISGPLFDLPAGSVKGAIGAEYRQEFLSDSPDALVSEGWAANTTQPTAGGYNVGAIYGEMSIPLLANSPVAKALILTPSVRWDHYSTFGNATTGKIGLNWTVNDDIRFRASYSTGFRAPSTAELYGGNAITDIPASGDPCDTGPDLNGNSNIGKGLTGVSHANSTCAQALANASAATVVNGALIHYNSPQDATKDNQEQVLIGGNPNLKPETSRDYSVGMVLTPSFVPGFAFTIDYYNDVIHNTILTGGFSDAVTSPGPDLVLLGCYGPAQNQTFCNLIHRSSAGTIVQIDSLNANFGIEAVEGIDYEFSYDTAAAHMNLPIPGSFRFDLQLSQLITHTNQNPDGTTNVAQGTFSTTSESVQPKWKAMLSVDYTKDAWAVHWDTRFISNTIPIGSGPNDFTGYGARTGNIFYNDLSASYEFKDVAFANMVRVTLGIDNLFDQDPPFIGTDSTCKCNSIAGPYDFTGRFFYAKVSSKF